MCPLALLLDCHLVPSAHRGLPLRWPATGRPTVPNRRLFGAHSSGADRIGCAGVSGSAGAYPPALIALSRERSGVLTLAGGGSTARFTNIAVGPVMRSACVIAMPPTLPYTCALQSSLRQCRGPCGSRYAGPVDHAPCNAILGTRLESVHVSDGVDTCASLDAREGRVR